MGYSRPDSKAVLRTRLASVSAEESSCASTEDNAMDAAVSVTGKRDSTPADVAEYSDGPPQNQENWYRADAPLLAFVADKEVVKARAQWRYPEL